MNKSERRYDLDWLRVLAILSVFLYHSTRFFNLEDWHVKNAMTYAWVEALESFMEIWMMPLIFLISGASIFFAMDKGGAGKFFKGKVLRLLVPLVVGVFTHASLQVYLERLTHGQFSGSYFEFLPHYFEGVYLDVGVGGNFAFAGMHLWYLLFLFLFSLVCYSLFRWLKGSGRRVLSGLGGLLALSGAMYLLLALPVVVMEALTGNTPLGEIDPGGWTFPLYLCFFVSGFVVVSHERLQERIRQLRWVSLTLGSALLVTFIWMGIRADNDPAFVATFEIADDLLATLSAWGLILGFLGLAMQRLTFSKPFLKYTNDAVLPFYILHQTILLCVGYFVVQWAIPDLLKWMIIAASSFAIIIGLYEFLVRRFNGLRILFGMKAVRQAAPVVTVLTQPLSEKS
jgi:peptidoglycan/LPS O-acetylase OafA/YrhL